MRYLRITMIAVTLAAASIGIGVAAVNRSGALKLKRGSSVKDAETEFAPNLVKTSGLAHRTASHRRLVQVNSAALIHGRFILGAQDKRESAVV